MSKMKNLENVTETSTAMQQINVKQHTRGNEKAHDNGTHQGQSLISARNQASMT
jgi:hypothetical protein